jgi:putative DNA primase/helicase
MVSPKKGKPTIKGKTTEGLQMNKFKIYEELKKRGVETDTKGYVKRFNPNFFPQYIKNRLQIIYSKYGAYYIYGNGFWKIQDDDKILKLLREIFQEPKFGIWTPTIESDYVVAMKRELYHEAEMNPDKSLINVENGMFDTNTFELKPHDYRYYSTVRIPITVLPNSKCPRFLKFLDEIFEGDEERIRVTQEWAGYLLTTETKAQKALLLLGEGENGKGVLIDTLSEIIGEDNISNIPLNELGRSFSRVKIYSKTANISGENEMDGKSFNTQYFKLIVGQDTISAEEKNKPVFSFKPTAKLVMTMNKLPDTRDTSYGYFRRLSILAFNAKFSGKDRDNDLREKLREELSGIFLWSMEGLKRLRENDYKFSPCKSMEDTLKRYRFEQKPMYEFFEDCIVPTENTGDREDNKLVYNTYKNWAVENGINAKISSQKFWKEFEAIAEKKGYEISSGRSNAFRYHTGIKVVGEYKAILGIKPVNEYTVLIDDEISKL